MVYKSYLLPKLSLSALLSAKIEAILLLLLLKREEEEVEAEGELLSTLYT